MNRHVLRTSGFLRAARRLLKRQPELVPVLQTTLELLAQDAFDARLKTHKLKGDLQGLWACSAGYDLRIVFEFVQDEGAEAILLHTIGTHDEVY